MMPETTKDPKSEQTAHQPFPPPAPPFGPQHNRNILNKPTVAPETTSEVLPPPPLLTEKNSKPQDIPNTQTNSNITPTTLPPTPDPKNPAENDHSQPEANPQNGAIKVTIVEGKEPSEPNPPSSASQAHTPTDENAPTDKTFLDYLKEQSAAKNPNIEEAPGNSPNKEHFFRCFDGTVFAVHPSNDTVRITYNIPENSAVTDVKENPHLIEYFKKFDEPTLNVSFQVENDNDFQKLKNFIEIMSLSAEGAHKKLNLNFGDVQVNNSNTVLQKKVAEFIAEKTVEVKSDATSTAAPAEQRYTSVNPPPRIKGLVDSSVESLRQKQQPDNTYGMSNHP